jgi:hypothetical protein
MKKILLALFVTVLVLSCEPVVSIPGETVEGKPSFSVGISGSRAVSFNLNETAADADALAKVNYYTLAPPITGWESGSYEIGVSYPIDVMGFPVSLVISKDGDNIIYTGNYDDVDNNSSFSFVLFPNGSFTFESAVILLDSVTNTDGFACKTLASGELLNSSLTGTGVSWNYILINGIPQYNHNWFDFRTYDGNFATLRTHVAVATGSLPVEQIISIYAENFSVVEDTWNTLSTPNDEIGDLLYGFYNNKWLNSNTDSTVDIDAVWAALNP